MAQDVILTNGVDLSAVTAPVNIEDRSVEANSIKLTPKQNKSASASVGGALYIDNSSSTGVGLGVFSTQASPSGRLAYFRANNASFSQSVLRVENAGTGAGIDLSSTGTGVGVQVAAAGGATEGSKHALGVSLTNTGSTTSCAGSFTSANTAHSCLQLTGNETGRGTLKISHVGQSGSTDANASAISIDLDATAGTAAQGIFIDSTGGSGTTGNLIEVRNNAVNRFRISSAGNAIMGCPTSAYASGSMWNNSVAMHVNEGGNLLTFTVKYSGGTVKTGTVALV